MPALILSFWHCLSHGVEFSRSTRTVFIGYTKSIKEVIVYDYADLRVPMLAKMYGRRRLG